MDNYQLLDEKQKLELFIKLEEDADEEQENKEEDEDEIDYTEIFRDNGVHKLNYPKLYLGIGKPYDLNQLKDALDK